MDRGKHQKLSKSFEGLNMWQLWPWPLNTFSVFLALRPALFYYGHSGSLDKFGMVDPFLLTTCPLNCSEVTHPGAITGFHCSSQKSIIRGLGALNTSSLSRLQFGNGTLQSDPPMVSSRSLSPSACRRAIVSCHKSGDCEKRLARSSAENGT